ncbi:aldehyde dehydrogenase family protein [Chryseomicrobium palamuruense]|uniref:Aldehyde dehydrogenase family protein n=1 Tax=Chryseomicrobium palamuruense TaxID=682973 RepID=A0ABV8USN8_9BACL
MNQFIEITNQFINGQWKKGTANKTAEIQNPYNNEVLKVVTIASKEDVNDAYVAAQKAQKVWANVSPEEKKKVLLKAAQYLQDHEDEILEVLVKDSGSSVFKSKFEIHASVEALKEAADYPKQTNTVTTPSAIPDKVNHIIRKPIGVVTSISPFNFPLFLSIRTIAPAIATGNAVVHKPDLQTSISGGVIFAKMFEEAGLPPGAFNLIVTDVTELGDYLIEHPIPKLISFTGSTAVGKHIGKIAGESLKRVALELGGNSPFLVLEDANVDEAVDAALFGKFLHSGQICMIVNRMLVHRAVYDEFVEKFVSRATKIKVGNPEDPEILLGPLINERQIEKVLNMAEMAEKEGARVALRGKRVGNTVTPFVFTDVSNDSTIAQSEIFGPIATIIPFDTEEEGIRLANETEYGLSSGIFTKDLERGLEVAKQIESGMAHVNDQPVNVEAGMPFGGEKGSGVGRFGGQWAFNEFTTVQWVTVQEKPRQFPFE